MNSRFARLALALHSRLVLHVGSHFGSHLGLHLDSRAYHFPLSEWLAPPLLLEAFARCRRSIHPSYYIPRPTRSHVLRTPPTLPNWHWRLTERPAALPHSIRRARVSCLASRSVRTVLFFFGATLLDFCPIHAPLRSVREVALAIHEAHTSPVALRRPRHLLPESDSD